MKLNKKQRKGKENNIFKCSYCGKNISKSEFMGTAYRNHCPFCLWSKHVDLEKSGDRKANCRAMMKPIGLTFKKEGIDKYKKPREGELMLIHQCVLCKKISINRIAGDDDPEVILELFEKSKNISQKELEFLNKEGIELLKEKDRDKVFIQLFGKN